MEKKGKTIMIYVLAALLCSFLWAGATIAAKMLAGTIPAFAFAFIRFGLSSLCLVPFIMMQKREKLKMRDLPVILFLGFSLVLLFNALYFVALYYASATSVALIGATNPILTMLASAIMFRHIPNKYQLFAFLLSFIGVSLVITHGKMGFAVITGSIGELLALTAVISHIMYTMALKKISAHYSPLFLTFATGISGMLFVLPFIANKEFVKVTIYLTNTQWGLLAFIGLFGTALAIYLYSIAVKHIGPARTSLISWSAMPVFVFILAYLLLGEKISLWQIVGGILVMSSLAIGLRHTK